MHKSLMMATVLALAVAAPAVQAQQIDSNGKCHGADGKPAKVSVCTKSMRAPPMKCRDIRTQKSTKCGGPNAEPLPAQY